MCNRGKTKQDVLFAGPAVRDEREGSPKGRETIRRVGLAVRVAEFHTKGDREKARSYRQ